MSEAFVYDAIRTPRGKGKKDGSLHEVKPVNLLAGGEQPAAQAGGQGFRGGIWEHGQDRSGAGGRRKSVARPMTASES